MRGFGEARLARWYGYHKAIATTYKSRRNPAPGDPKSPTGQRCAPPVMAGIAVQHAPCRQRISQAILARQFIAERFGEKLISAAAIGLHRLTLANIANLENTLPDVTAVGGVRGDLDRDRISGCRADLGPDAHCFVGNDVCPKPFGHG